MVLLWSKSGGLVAPVGIVLGTPVLGHAATEALRMTGAGFRASLPIGRTGRANQVHDVTAPRRACALSTSGHGRSMEALETAINYWDDALAAYTSVSAGPLAVTTGDEAQFCEDLQRLVDQAYELQEQCELLFLDQRSVLFRTDSSNRMYSELHSAVTSSAESFVADLREFEEFAEFFPDVENLPLYQAAKAHFESGGAIPYRTLRTEMVRCSSDVEFICKLHCIRLALTAMFREKANWQWLADTGRQILTDILIYGDKDPKDLLIAYEDMLSFLQNEDNWPQMEQELSLKGVKAMTMYDILLDYIIMDAFDDLDMPPSSVTAVVQNRWLSNGFKETALTTAVWSLFKAKRRMLRFADGFISHFYAISEQISPMMAWGFLGPDEGLKDICHFFRDQVTGLLVDMFSFQKCRYSTVPELSQDILQLMKNRADGIGHKLKTNLCDVVQ
uniref:Mitoguardin n=1 Tax=Timema douglasi TaxID=61478 RepID=A0A7R8VRE1_TIMDO|nr:unnamed protein product [Timema douglasi]